MQFPCLRLGLIVAILLAAAPATHSADPPLDSLEQKVLDKWNGSWRSSYKMPKAEWTPEEKTGTADLATARVVGGRFIQEKSEHSDKSSGNLMLTYDTEKKCYRGWWFSSAGHTSESAGDWDDRTKTMTWKSNEGGNESTTKHRFLDDDNSEWSVVVKDGGGKVLLLIDGKSARVNDTEDFLKPDNWVGRADVWRIENGSIVGETEEDLKYNTFLVSKAKYSDFELSFKVQLRDGVGNSGVQIRSTLRDDKKFVVAGPQADIGEQYWGSLHGEGIGGTIKGVDAKKVAAVVKPNEFNEYKIVAKGTRITITVNGETMVDDDVKTLPVPKGTPAPLDGIIAFQAHSGQPGLRVQFKEIKFKNLGKK